jgi:hypothetical protein
VKVILIHSNFKVRDSTIIFQTGMQALLFLFGDTDVPITENSTVKNSSHIMQIPLNITIFEQKIIYNFS